MENTDYNPIAKAASVVRHMNADDRMRELARIREDRYVNEQLALGEAIQKGITIGEARGITIGEARGITIGEMASKRTIAKSLLSHNMTPEFVSKATGLTVEEIKELL